LARGDWDGAKKLAAQAESWGADGGLVGQVMVAAARGGGASDEALVAAQKWTVNRPFDGDGWNTLGAVQAENGQLENALASLKRAVDLSPANGAAALNIAMLHQALGQYREAVQWYERVWVSHPELFKKEAGRYEEARRLLGEEPAGKGRE
jgi:tetratricopeptide (TPR) repeat protein